MNWASIAMIALGLIPTVVKDIEAIITGAKQGMTKKQLAIASIQAATGIADQTLTGSDLDAANAVSSLVSNTIDAVVTRNNATGVFTQTPAQLPAPTVQATSQAVTAQATPIAEVAATA